MAAFFDKIGSMAKNMTDRAGDALEINRINSKINSEKTRISHLKFQLGEYFWTRYEAGDTFSEEAQDILNEIVTCQETIATYEAEIQRIRAENEAQNHTNNAATPLSCPVCGAELNNKPELNFCPKCGAKIEHTEPEPQEEQEESPIFCKNCGNQLSPEQRFCGVCGTKVELS